MYSNKAAHGTRNSNALDENRRMEMEQCSDKGNKITFVTLQFQHLSPLMGKATDKGNKKEKLPRCDI